MKQWIAENFREMVLRDFPNPEEKYTDQLFYINFDADEYIRINKLDGLVSVHETQALFEEIKNKHIGGELNGNGCYK